MFCTNCIIIIWINYDDDDDNNNNNNNWRVNNNYGRLQDLVFLFKIPMRARKHFFEIYRQFWHAPSGKVRQPCCKPTAFSWLHIKVIQINTISLNKLFLFLFRLATLYHLQVTRSEKGHERRIWITQEGRQQLPRAGNRWGKPTGWSIDNVW